MGNKNKIPKIGLALSGGSALGIAHIGVIKALKKNNIPINCVSGASAGAVVAACLAFDVPLEKMIEAAKKMNWSKISKFGFSKMGIESNEPLGKIIKEIIGDVNIEDAKIPLGIVAADVDTGEKIVFRKGNVARAIMASSCIPAYFIPVKIGGRKLVDGGVVENMPMSVLREMKAEIRIGVDLKHWRTRKETKNILNVITNTYGIMISQQKTEPMDSSEFIIRPHLEKFKFSDFKREGQLVSAGFVAMEQRIPEIKKKIHFHGSFFGKLVRKVIDFFKSP